MPLETSRTLNSASFRAYQLIKDKIIRNEFDSRQRLNEIDLAKSLKLSRTPVREALIMLVKDDLITRYEGSRGFYLRRYSLQDIHDLYEFREMIELASAGRIIQNVQDQHVENMAAILSEAQDIIHQARPADALVKALDFHIYCTQVCTNNSFITNALRNCYEKLTIVSWTWQDLNACVSSALEHEEMLDALRERDFDRLVKCTRKHIHGARDRMMEALKAGAEKLYFLP